MHATERWAHVIGAPDYQVSDTGRVVSYRRKQPYEMSGSRNQRGYRMVMLCQQDGTVRLRTVHRLVAEAFIGPLPENMETRHLDGNKDNNAASNLSYGTRSENALDKVAHGSHNEARKTHCPQGHAYDDLNTHHAHGRRYCRACRSARRQAVAA